MEQSTAPARTWTYKLTQKVVEGSQGRPIWSIVFNHIDSLHKDVFASVGGNMACVYLCPPQGAIKLLQVFEDEDEKEDLFACAWSTLECSGAPLLCVGGAKGLLRVLDCHRRREHWSAPGHGNSISDIALHPLRPAIAVTASKVSGTQDQSLRVWNIASRVCVAVISGESCHCNDILSIDFHPGDPDCLVSGGMDNAVMIWSLAGLKDDVARSACFDHAEGLGFPARHLSCPEFSTSKAHSAPHTHASYVDCVRFLGGLVASKGMDGAIRLWAPAPGPRPGLCKGNIRLVQELHFPEAGTMWWVRFALTPAGDVLACGTPKGQVLLWSPESPTFQPRATLRRAASAAPVPVRQTALSYNGSIVLGCCDDSTIWRWDAIQKGPQRADKAH